MTLTKAGLVISVRICKMEITVQLAVIKIYRHSVMGFLVYCPDSSCQVETCVPLVKLAPKKSKNGTLHRYRLLPLQEVLPG
jgi:hypothetical protein